MTWKGSVLMALKNALCDLWDVSLADALRKSRMIVAGLT